jgi:SAM-dependent methyltransferase
MAADKHDWEIIARRDAFFSVVAVAEFRSAGMTDERRRLFYQSGEEDIARVLGWFDTDLGARPAGGRALDIGCGVGRLVCAMAKVADQVSGYDVSETMLAHARKVAPANVELSPTLPAGPYDWINSYIVFQHIPPPEGLALIEACLARAAPGCFLSLQITGWRDGARPSTHLAGRIRRWLDRMIQRSSVGAPEKLIRMYDYDFSDVLQRVTAAGFERIVLRHTDHVGHHGAWFIGRKA